MKQYLDLLQDILDNGFDHEDRTGGGRRSVYCRQLRFKMADGFPLVTTRKANMDIVIKELLWFLRGGNNVQDLGCKIWDQWAVSEKDIDKWLDRHFDSFYSQFPEAHHQSDHPTDLEIQSQAELKQRVRDGFRQRLIEDHKDTIGPLYGISWRSIRTTPYYPSRLNNTARKALDDYSPTKLLELQELYNHRVELFSHQHDEQTEMLEKMAFEDFVALAEETSVDQIEELVYGLKTKPFSARHVVSAWIPEWIPSECLSPQENVIGGKGALAPCHMMFQCFVSPPDMTTGSKYRLSLMMYQRSVDTAIGAVTNIAQYSLLLHMLAQVTDMEPYEFIWNTGDTHLYFSHIEGVKEQLKRNPWTLPRLQLNPDIKDIFAFKPEDIQLVDYKCWDPIKFTTYT